MRKELLAAPVLLSLGFGAFAHDYVRDHQFTITPYGTWLFTSSDVNSSAGNTVHNYFDDSEDAFAFGGKFAYEKGSYFAELDVEFSEFSYSDDFLTEGVTMGRDASYDTTIVHLQGGHLSHRWHSGSMGYNLYTLGGVKYINVNGKYGLTDNGVAYGDPIDIDGEFWLPTVGLRLTGEHYNGFFFDLGGDYGYDFSDNSSWDVYTNVGYKFNDRWKAFVGYRFSGHDLTDFEQDKAGDFELTTVSSGPTAGFSFTF